MSGGLFLLATAYRAVLQVLGGYLTARLAPSRPMRHVWILAFIGLAMSLLGVLAWTVMGPEAGPLWYPLLLVVLTIPTLWIGGRIHLRSFTAVSGS